MSRSKLPWLRSLFSLAATLVILSALTVSLTRATAVASVAGQTTIYPGISNPTGIASGPDGALWFTNQDNASIGRVALPKPR